MNHLTDAIVHAFVEGRLDDNAAVTAALHLDGCPACVARVDALDPLVSAFDAMPDLQAPPELAAAVLSQVNAPPLETRIDLIVGFALLALAAALVLVVGDPVNAIVRAGLLFDALGTATSKLAVAANASVVAMAFVTVTVATLSLAATRISVAVAPRSLP